MLGSLPEEFAMVGNSLRSDVLSVVEIGAGAFHIPAPASFEALGAALEAGSGYQTLTRLTDLLAALDAPETEPG